MTDRPCTWAPQKTVCCRIKEQGSERYLRFHAISGIELRPKHDRVNADKIRLTLMNVQEDDESVTTKKGMRWHKFKTGSCAWHAFSNLRDPDSNMRFELDPVVDVWFKDFMPHMVNGPPCSNTFIYTARYIFNMC